MLISLAKKKTDIRTILFVVGQAELSQCLFSNNNAMVSGDIISVYSGSVNIAGCVFVSSNNTLFNTTSMNDKEKDGECSLPIVNMDQSSNPFICWWHYILFQLLSWRKWSCHNFGRITFWQMYIFGKQCH